MMDIIPKKKVKSMRNVFITNEMISNMSRCNVTSHIGFDNGINKENSLYDLRMGTNTRDYNCLTCGCDVNTGGGHFGSIELAMPIINPLVIKEVSYIYGLLCNNCGQMLPTTTMRKKISLEKIEDRLSVARELISKKTIVCSYCGTSNANSYKIEDNIRITDDKKEISPITIRGAFDKLKDADIELIGLACHPRDFIMNKILVLPIQLRPNNVIGDGKKSETSITKHYINIVKKNEELKVLLKTTNITDTSSKEYLPISDLYKTICTLIIQMMLDKSGSASGIQSLSSHKTLDSIETIWKGKEGLIRGRIFGKKVDYSSRSVIRGSNDLYCDEVGIPKAIAKIETITETVNPNNIDKMRRYVQNGSDNWPGANRIIKAGTGYKISLKKATHEQLKKASTELSTGDIVYRHQMDGDIGMFNRQPSLHMLSFQGLRARIIDGNTYCLPTSICKSLNADFDGDEMNHHTCHNYIARAELQEQMISNKHIINPANSGTVIYPIQDNVLGIWMLSKNGKTEIPREVFISIAFKCKNIDEKFDRIVAPYNLGHFIDIIIPINLTFIYKDIQIINGKFISGTFDEGGLKAIIQSLFNNYGSEVTREFIYNIQIITDHYLAYTGFSVGIIDCHIGHGDENIEKDVKEQIKGYLLMAENENNRLVERFAIGDIIIPMTRTHSEEFEIQARNIIGKYDIKCQELIVKHINPKNSFLPMVYSKSKGNISNIYAIMSHVGQQSINGARILPMYGDRVLPHFYKFDQSLISRGYIKNSYADGLDIIEFFLLGAGGREGLIDTAMKTAEVGYIGRKLVKICEGNMISYDNCVRYNGDRVVSYLYGGYGYDTTFLNDNKLSAFSLSREEFEKKINE